MTIRAGVAATALRRQSQKMRSSRSSSELISEKKTMGLERWLHG